MSRRMTGCVLFSAGLAACLAASASAQRIWIVAPTGGDFTTLPPAIAAASPGDSILVRQTVTEATVIDKGVSVYIEGLVTHGVFTIRNIAAGQVAQLGVCATG